MDMEMVQFHPTGLVVPESRLNGALLEEGLRGAGAHLFNGEGERYMARYDREKMERSTRDRVSRAAFEEIIQRPNEQETVPALPTAGVVQLQPTGNESDTKSVPVGRTSVIVVLSASWIPVFCNVIA